MIPYVMKDKMKQTGENQKLLIFNNLRINCYCSIEEYQRILRTTQKYIPAWYKGFNQILLKIILRLDFFTHHFVSVLLCPLVLERDIGRIESAGKYQWRHLPLNLFRLFWIFEVFFNLFDLLGCFSDVNHAKSDNIWIVILQDSCKIWQV